MSRFARASASALVQQKPAVPQCDADLVGSSSTQPSHVLGATLTSEVVERVSRGLPATEIVAPLCGCRVEMANFTCMNWGARHENEDRFLTHRDVHKPEMVDFQTASVPKLPKMEALPVDVYTIGVLDGHDTDAASDKVAKLLPGVMSRLLKEQKMPVAEAYVQAMAEIEDELKKHISTAGACVLSCTVAGRYVWCSNLGDCRAALVTLGAPKSPSAAVQVESLHWMSRDMKASAPHERQRITRAGGTVIDGRVEGLEPSRTLGDFDVKMQVAKDVISIVPEVRCHAVSGGNGAVRQALLVMATDGVWDVLSGQDVCDLIVARKELCTLQAAEATAAAAGERSPETGPCAPRQAPVGRSSSKSQAAQSRAGSSPATVLWDLAEDMVQFSIAKGSRDDCTAVVALISVYPMALPQ